MKKNNKVKDKKAIYAGASEKNIDNVVKGKRDYKDPLEMKPC